MKQNLPQGLYPFLITVAHLIHNAKKISCSDVQQNLNSGIATYLYKKHRAFFDELSCSEFLPELDDFYRQFIGCVEGSEDRKYACKHDEGLVLILALALNEMR